MLNYVKRAFTPAPTGPDAQTGLSQEELQEWNAKVAIIDEWWDWFTGKALEEEDSTQPAKDGKRPLKYPLQINPVKQAAQLHAYCLFGETPDTSEPLVKTAFEPRAGEDKVVAQHAESVLLDVEYENNTRGMDTDMGLSIQSLGAIVLKVGWDPESPMTLPTGIRYEYFDPRDCWFHWKGTDYFNLEAAWVKFTLSREEAEGYGVKPKGANATYVEYWSRDRFWIKIDDEFARDKKGNPYSQRNAWGFVPFIYVPHVRVNDFWGLSIVPDVVGLVKELNSRMADVGDSVHLSVNDIIVARNIKYGFPVQHTLPGGQTYVNLGRAMSNSDPQPDMERLQSPALPTGAERFNDDLLEQTRIGMNTPEVAYGKEEGTQRSGETLYSRMWPLLAHVRTERTWWTVARNLRAEMALKILAENQRSGITASHLGYRKRQLWAPMLPIDRRQLIDELIRRAEQDTISLEHLLERYGDVSDIEAEIKRIREMQERSAELQAQSRPQPAPKEDVTDGSPAS